MIHLGMLLLVLSGFGLGLYVNSEKPATLVVALLCFISGGYLILGGG